MFILWLSKIKLSNREHLVDSANLNENKEDEHEFSNNLEVDNAMSD